MSSTKLPERPLEDVREVLEGLSETASWDEIEYAIYVRRKVREGQQAISRGEFVSTDEARQRMQQWLR